MGGSIYTLFRNWRDDVAGNFATLSALSLPPILVLFAGLITYSNMVTLKTQTQAAVDAAALAASTAFATGAVHTANDAQAIATKVFTGNAPADAISGQTCLTATTVPPGPGVGYVTTTMNYCGNAKSMFGNLFSALNSFTATSTSSAKMVNAQSGAGTINGYGDSWGDPHAVGANGENFTYDCVVGSYEHVFSDYGIQINGLCAAMGGAYVLSDVAMVIGGHYLTITSGYVSSSMNGTFLGVVQVDGVPTTPASAGVFTVLNDAKQNIVVQDNYGAPGAADSYDNYVTVTTPEYVVTANYANGGSLELQVTATNAGACGIPGGVLGQTFGPAGSVDTNGYDFVAPSQWYLAPQYSATCATAAKASQLGRTALTK